MNRLVVDTSALIAICLDEPDAALMRQTMAKCIELWISAPSMLELGIVGLQRGVASESLALLQLLDIKVAAFDESLAKEAITAFERFGKGRHKAALNFGDCCSYALAQSRDLPLLFKGADFLHTDVRVALTS